MPRIPAGMRKTVRGTYESRFTIHGKRYSVYGKTVKECKEKELARRQEIEEGLRYSGRELTLDQYFLKWEQGRLGSVRASTIRTERYIYRLAADITLSPEGCRLGAMSLDKLGTRHVRDVQTALWQRYKPATVNRSISVIRAVLESALVERLIAWNPTRGMRSLKLQEKPARETIHRALTLEETEAFFRAAEKRGSWYIPFYTFLLNTGCRFGEAGALMPGDFCDGLIHIERTLTRTVDGHQIVGDSTKTGHSMRVIPARRAALEAVKAQQRQNRLRFGEEANAEEAGPIFRAPRGGLLGARGIMKDIDLICRDDTFATRAVESGMQAKTLQEILGHADISITMNLYAHVMEETKRRQMDAVAVMP